MQELAIEEKTTVPFLSIAQDTPNRGFCMLNVKQDRIRYHFTGFGNKKTQPWPLVGFKLATSESQGGHSNHFVTELVACNAVESSSVDGINEGITSVPQTLLSAGRMLRSSKAKTRITLPY